jgi:valyl-tRNA synthetase
MISGHGLDEQGRKISKRLGNYVPSDKLIEEYGADAVRYWATGASLGQNLRFNPKEIKKGKQITIKLWNVARFIEMNGINTDPNQNLEQPDLWIISETNKTIKNTTNYFENFEYAKAKNEIETFFMSKFADYYIEFVKYRLNENDEESKASAQYTLNTVFTIILKLFAPIIPFIAEEIYSFTNKESIHKSSWPEEIKANEPDDDFINAIEAIDEIRKYKSENKISLGKELDEYKLNTKVNLIKYKEFIQKAIKVKKIQ